MKQLSIAGFAALLLVGTGSVRASEGQCSTLLQHKLTTLQGTTEDLCDYQGKVLLIVNTASYCGFTAQYRGLEGLYRKYGDRGFAVLGFPSNDFGQQEPGSNKDIAAFCERAYEVRFPMFEKSSVIGSRANPLFRELARLSGQGPQWNFHKYLVDRKGVYVVSFASDVTPDSPALTSRLEAMLSAPTARR